MNIVADFNIIVKNEVNKLILLKEPNHISLFVQV